MIVAAVVLLGFVVVLSMAGLCVGLDWWFYLLLLIALVRFELSCICGLLFDLCFFDWFGLIVFVVYSLFVLLDKADWFAWVSYCGRGWVLVIGLGVLLYYVVYC